MDDFITLHVNETAQFPGADLFVTLLSFEITGGGKETEEFGEITKLKFLFKEGNKEKIINFGWAEVIPDCDKNFAVFNYRIFHVHDSNDIFQREDEKGFWISLRAVLLSLSK